MKRRSPLKGRKQIVHPEPTPEQIAERAAKIREAWSADQHYIRAGEIPPDDRDLQPPRLRGYREPED